MDERGARVITWVLVAIVVAQVAGAVVIWTLDAVGEQGLIGLGIGLESLLTVEALALGGLLLRRHGKGSGVP